MEQINDQDEKWKFESLSQDVLHRVAARQQASLVESTKSEKRSIYVTLAHRLIIILMIYDITTSSSVNL